MRVALYTFLVRVSVQMYFNKVKYVTVKDLIYTTKLIGLNFDLNERFER